MVGRGVENFAFFNRFWRRFKPISVENLQKRKFFFCGFSAEIGLKWRQKRLKKVKLSTPRPTMVGAASKSLGIKDAYIGEKLHFFFIFSPKISHLAQMNQMARFVMTSIKRKSEPNFFRLWKKGFLGESVKKPLFCHRQNYWVYGDFLQQVALWRHSEPLCNFWWSLAQQVKVRNVLKNRKF